MAQGEGEESVSCLDGSVPSAPTCGEDRGLSASARDWWTVGGEEPPTSASEKLDGVDGRPPAVPGTVHSPQPWFHFWGVSMPPLHKGSVGACGRLSFNVPLQITSSRVHFLHTSINLVA